MNSDLVQMTEEQRAEMKSTARRLLIHHPEWSQDLLTNHLGVQVLPGGRLSNTVSKATRTEVLLETLGEVTREYGTYPVPLTQEQTEDIVEKARLAIEEHPFWTLDAVAHWVGNFRMPGGRPINTVDLAIRETLVQRAFTWIQKEEEQ